MKLKITISTVIIFVTFSCQKENEPPTINSITASSTTIKISETTQLTCIATDPNGDKLSYLWESLAGRFPKGSNTNSVNWEAPLGAGSYNISITVSDYEMSVIDTINIVVERDYNTFVDARDNREYKWVTIGNQDWMAENLAYLPSVSSTKFGSYIEPYYYVLTVQSNNVSDAKVSDYYNTYGVLYNYPAALKACPNGWHLPSDSEWEQLSEFISNDNGGYSKYEDRWLDLGKHLKATYGWGISGNGTDDYGFSALPPGSRNLDGTYYGSGKFIAYWWSSSEQVVNQNPNEFIYHSWIRLVYPTNNDFARSHNGKSAGYSVRCVRD